MEVKMIEVALQYLIGSAIALLGLGIGIGYKIAERKTDIKSEDFFCELAHFSQPSEVKVIYENGKKSSTNCSSFVDKNKKCILTNDQCIIFSNFDYRKKYASIISQLKN